MLLKEEIILTKNSLFFVEKLIPNLIKFEEDKNVKFYQDEDEWKEWDLKCKVLHIEVIINE
jgi:hypothetical protein